MNSKASLSRFSDDIFFNSALLILARHVGELTMTTYVRKPLPIDKKKSVFWALASLGSIGVGPVGVQLFDLVNRETHRAHRLELKTGGLSLGLPISGSYGASDYENFRTPREVSFFDFDGTDMTVRETNIGLYSWTSVSFWGITVRISGGGLNIPGLGVSNGTAKILFSDGFPVGSVDLILPPPPIPKEPEPFKEYAKEDAAVYRVPGDILFDFDKHLLKPGRRTQDALHLVGTYIYKIPDYRYLVIGHTDAIGGRGYNVRLSKRRAKTVANWFKEHNYGGPEWIKIVGKGKSEPIASNATLEGRALNRRVEVVSIRTKLWESYLPEEPPSP